MSADLPKKDWVSILKRNNSLTRENIRRALGHASDDGERQALQAEIDRLNAKNANNNSTKGKTQPGGAKSSGRGFGTHNQRVEIPPEYHFFVDHLPYKPYCTDDLTTGLRVRPAQQALTHAYLQFNSPAMVWTLVQDIDREVDSDYFSRHKAPQPNRVVKNPANGHAHALYFLACGVCRTSAGRLKPLRYLAAIEGALCRQLQADPGFAGLVTKNPLHPAWETWNLHDHQYTLAELAAPLDLAASANEKAYRGDSGVGRNVTTFDTVRLWSYNAVRDFWAPGGFDRWHKAVAAHVAAVNCQFPTPLPFGELKAIAKSIAGWTWRNITPKGLQELIQRTHTSDLQAERGRKATNQAAAGLASGEARRLSKEQERATARLMRSQGKTQRAIADALGVTQQAVSKWLHN